MTENDEALVCSEVEEVPIPMERREAVGVDNLIAKHFESCIVLTPIFFSWSLSP